VNFENKDDKNVVVTTARNKTVKAKLPGLLLTEWKDKDSAEAAG
jgi:hypothetical protein